VDAKCKGLKKMFVFSNPTLPSKTPRPLSFWGILKKKLKMEKNQ